MKIAIVSSGLWHVRRGIEVWASTLAGALADKGVNVTLFCGSPAVDGGSCGSGIVRVMPCRCRGTIMNAGLTMIFSRFGGWRYGYGSEYQTEQATMASGLIKALRCGGYSFVHLQDPWLARLLEEAHVAGRHTAEVILAHGTEEPVEFLGKFRHVQELSPCYLARHAGNAVLQGQTRHCIPNFVDTAVFKPSDKQAARKRLGLPPDSFVILSVGAVDHAHKRMRILVDEFALVDRGDALLVIAGPCAGDPGKELLSHANKLLGNRFRYYSDLKHFEMPGLYSAADLFVLCSLCEIFGIVFLEAMACGVPCLGHVYPVTEWIVDGGGACVDMTAQGFLPQFLRGVDPEWIRSHGAQARERAVKQFSVDVVVKQIAQMYEDVAGKSWQERCRQDEE